VLRVRLFGTIRVSHDGFGPETRPIHGVQALLAYLLLHRNRHHSREALGGLFWGEHSEPRARSCLSTALWRLRQVLEPPGVPRGTYLLVQAGGEVGFNSESDHWLDVAAFEDALSRRHDWAALETAVRQYSGDLLEGFYDEWALRERERLRMLYLDGLNRLVERHSAEGAIDAALGCARRVLELDPLREEVHREVIRLHLRQGHRALALRQYLTCRSLLAEELNVEPMEETRALGAQILAEPGRADTTDLPGPTTPDLLPPLRSAARRLNQAREELARAISTAEAARRSRETPVRPS